MERKLESEVVGLGVGVKVKRSKSYKKKKRRKELWKKMYQTEEPTKRKGNRIIFS